MKKVLIIGISIGMMFSCNNAEKKNTNKQNVNSIVKTKIQIVLPNSLSNKRHVYESYIENAFNNIHSFAKKYKWDSLSKESFIDSMMVFDNKKEFDKSLLTLAEADTSMRLPKTYVGAIEKRTLLVVTPEIYSKVYPEGVERNSYEKLLTHEIAHRLHISILDGDEDAMGPIWFYEGFAVFTANQFSNSDKHFSKEEMAAIMNNPERNSYHDYGIIFRYFVQRVPLQQLIDSAKNENFNGWLLSKYDYDLMQNY